MNLKKVLIFFAAILMSFTLPCTLFAQDYGVKGGFVVSSVTGQDGAFYKPGLQLGAYKRFGIQESPHIQIEFLFTQKGSWNWDSQNTRNINLYYIEIPVLFGIEIVDNVNLNLGIQPSIFLGGVFRSRDEGVTSRTGLWGRVPIMDYSTLIGAEYIWNDDITFGLRYNHSFVPLQPRDNIFSENRNLPLSRVFQLYIRIKLDEDYLPNLMKKIKGN